MKNNVLPNSVIEEWFDHVEKDVEETEDEKNDPPV